MMGIMRPDRSDRIKSAAAVVALQALFGYGLIVALAADLPARLDDDLKIFGLAPMRPPRHVEPPASRRAVAPNPAGAASPPHLRALPTAIAAPPPVVPPIVVPPVTAAPTPGAGSNPSAGASPVPGHGTGSGGLGDGTGSGGAGDGAGGGGTAARWIRGRIRDADYPPAASEAGVQGDLTTRYAVGRDGRVTRCTVVRPSGNALLDETTCRLVVQRYRYRPARDARGKRVADSVTETHHWVLDEPPDDRAPEDRR